MPTITINETRVEVDEGTTILEAARQAGIKIPALCYHKDLIPQGACRVCLVEITAGGKSGLQASCLYRVTDGLEVKTDTERVVQARKIVFELLLARSPNSEKLKSLAAEYGVSGTRIKRKQEENCILCGLCVRACTEVSQRQAISFSGRGARRRIGTPYNRIAERCIGCGACVYVCPTGTIKIEEAE